MQKTGGTLSDSPSVLSDPAGRSESFGVEARVRRLQLCHPHIHHAEPLGERCGVLRGGAEVVHLLRDEDEILARHLRHVT